MARNGAQQPPQVKDNRPKLGFAKAKAHFTVFLRPMNEKGRNVVFDFSRMRAFVLFCVSMCRYLFASDVKVKANACKYTFGGTATA